MKKNSINYLEATPKDIEEMLGVAPVAYVPFGAMEWHGPHNILGLDGIKAQTISERAASFTGGVVFPTVYWGAYDTLKGFPYTVDFPRRFSRKMTCLMLEQLREMGFRVVVMISGHYPPSQVSFFRRVSRKYSKKYNDFFVLGIPEFLLALDKDYIGDHGASCETSIMMAIRPQSVHLERFPAGLNFIQRAKRHGTFGKDPALHASAEQGEMILAAITDRLSRAVNEALASNSFDPFKQIFLQADRFMKKFYSPSGLREFFDLNGIASIRQGLEYLRWTYLNGQKQTRK